MARYDLVSPDTGPTATRDAQGRIVGVTRLQSFGIFEYVNPEDPDYITAREMFDAGWRVHNWGAPLTDTSEIIEVSAPDGTFFEFADGVDRNTDRVLEYAGVTDEVFSHLSRMTERE